MLKINYNLEQRLDLKEIFNTNKNAWDLISPMHEHSAFYNLETFLKTKNSLHEIELKALGDISGKRILHLQPHICVDSISMAVRGAQVTVVDFSKEALRIGKKLAKRLNRNIDFVEQNGLDIKYDNHFDIVFLSYGALCWIPNLEIYFRSIYKALKPGGFFYFIDFHSNIFCYDAITGQRKYEITSEETPIHEYRKGSYASNVITKEYDVYYWIHSTSDMINALIRNHFKLYEMNEYDFLPFDCFPGLVQYDNQWKFKGNLTGLPHLTGIKSYK